MEGEVDQRLRIDVWDESWYNVFTEQKSVEFFTGAVRALNQI